MKNNNSDYRQIIKATSIFGGVQFISIVIAVLRSKFVALYLGPAGLGIVGLLTNAVGLIASATNLGLGTSAVKNIAEASVAGDENRVAVVVGVFKWLVSLTGLLGAFIVFFAASILSEMTFGNLDYVFSFRWISITLLFNQLASGQLVILQGLRKLSLLAKSSLTGSFVGLIVAVPIYYVFGINGIVPVFIVTAVLSWVFSYYYSRKVRIGKVGLSFKSLALEGKSMLAMGFLIGMTGIMDQLISYVTQIFISYFKDLNTVGLYSAGFAIINTYVGMIFTVMLTDYYPRLAGVSNDNVRSTLMINQQAEIAVLILAPLVILFLLLSNIIIGLLYSSDFMAIDKMIYWAMVGVLFKAVSWSVGIIVLAKGDSKKYLIVYLIAFMVILTSNIIGFYCLGLEGLGVAFLIANLIMSIVGFVVARHFYSFYFSKEFKSVFIIQLFLSLISFILVYFPLSYYSPIVGGIVLIASLSYSFKKLSSYIDFRKALLSIINRNSHKV